LVSASKTAGGGSMPFSAYILRMSKDLMFRRCCRMPPKIIPPKDIRTKKTQNTYQ
jgi:hypothetical protein